MSLDVESEYARAWLTEVALIAEAIPFAVVGRMARELHRVRECGGRLFILGVGGSAANASHAACDFRRLAGIEAYAPADNFAEFSAVANDIAWSETFRVWLFESCLRSIDAVLIMSVSGGTRTKSENLVEAARFARQREACVLAIVGTREGLVVELADVWLQVPCPNPDRRAYHSESFQGVVCHLLANELRGVDRK